MNKKMLFSKTNIFMVCLLCFCIPFSLMFYQCLTSETNFNLKIDRGFVSSDAVYFSFQADQATDEDIQVSEVFLADRSFRDAIRVMDDELYFFASQHEYVRAVCYQQGMELPPIQDGRFFSSEECWSETRLAVIGRTNIDQTWTQPDSGKLMITLDYGDYEVVGVMGTGEVSTIDDLIFVNIGSIDESEVLSGICYLDASNISADKLFRQFSAAVSSISLISTRKIDMPSTAADIVSGGVFFSEFLKYTIYGFLTVTFLCLLVFFIVSNRNRLAICMLNGQPYRQSLLSVSLPILIAGLTGVVLAVVSALLMVRFDFFKLPDSMVLESIAISSLIGLFTLLMFPVVQSFSIRYINLSESLR